MISCHTQGYYSYPEDISCIFRYMCILVWVLTVSTFDLNLGGASLIFSMRPMSMRTSSLCESMGKTSLLKVLLSCKRVPEKLSLHSTCSLVEWSVLQQVTDQWQAQQCSVHSRMDITIQLPSCVLHLQDAIDTHCHVQRLLQGVNITDCDYMAGLA